MKYLLLILIGLFLYLPALPNKFVWDDEEQVVANVAVHSVGNIPQLLAGSTFNSGGSASLAGLYYKPLMSICFAVIYTMFGPTPWAFHFFQIGLHLGSVLLLFIILKKLWNNEWLAFVGSLLFLIHPQNVETVVYISSLQDTLYMFFGLLGLTWIVISENKIGLWDYVFAGVCVFLALLGKETGGLFGVIIGVYMWIRSLHFGRDDGESGRDDVYKWLITLVGVYGLYLYLRLGMAHVGLGKNMFTPMATLPLLVRLGNIPTILFHYFSQFVWPSKLSISQHWADFKPGIFELLSLVGLVLVWVRGLWWGGKVRSEKGEGKSMNTSFVFFWIWLGVAMAFHSQIFPLDMTVADRWFYLPMVGVIGVVGSILQSEKLKVRSEKAVGIVISIILILFFVRSSIRIWDWRDGLTLYSHDIQITPQSFDLQNNLGVELFRVSRFDEAKKHFEISTKLSPTWWTNWNNLGAIVEREGDLELALDYYNKAIQNGNYYLAYPNYARVLLKQNKMYEARLFLKNSLQVFPNNITLLELFKYSEYTQN